MIFKWVQSPEQMPRQKMKVSRVKEVGAHPAIVAGGGSIFSRRFGFEHFVHEAIIASGPSIFSRRFLVPEAILIEGRAGHSRNILLIQRAEFDGGKWDLGEMGFYTWNIWLWHVLRL